jgi:hypothetical protein
MIVYQLNLYLHRLHDMTCEDGHENVLVGILRWTAMTYLTLTVLRD